MSFGESSKFVGGKVSLLYRKGHCNAKAQSGAALRSQENLNCSPTEYKGDGQADKQMGLMSTENISSQRNRGRHEDNKTIVPFSVGKHYDVFVWTEPTWRQNTPWTSFPTHANFVGLFFFLQWGKKIQVCTVSHCPGLSPFSIIQFPYMFCRW